MKLETNALVLKATDSGESDRILTLLTQDYGIVRAYANRAKKIGAKSSSATQILTYGHYTVYIGRNGNTLGEAKSERLFMGLRDDISKLSLAQYFCSLANEFVGEEEKSETALRVILNSLHFLENGQKSQLFLKMVTELKLLSIAGYMPQLGECPHCGKSESETMVFSFRDSAVYCPAASKEGTVITRGMLSAMRHITSCPVSRLYSFALPKDEERYLSELIEKYLLFTIEHPIKTLDFYKSVSV
ncbi:MAG: DNA repair protein RecO [Clostridiales bacterium]|nr:DNA repair protein RecO [Clostridiales bacterium]